VDGGMIQILSGIAENFVVATNHLQDLFDGEPVDTEISATRAIPRNRLLTRAAQNCDCDAYRAATVREPVYA
jgi:hypothetical protein